jgi:hypothetical protein
MSFSIRKVLSYIIFVIIAIFYFRLLMNWRISNTLDACVIVVRESDGRLGNKMFIYATALAVAIDHRCYMYIESSTLQTLKSIFHINPIRHISEDNFFQLQISRQLYNGCKFYTSIIRSNFKEVLELTGYWQKVTKGCMENLDQINE